ncbi:MAG: phosphoribosyltransferase family protein [Flavobacteriaceae bacterium]
MSQKILSTNEIDTKSLRIAYQILESNVEQQDIFIVGIQGNGYLLAEKLLNILKGISNKNFVLGKISLDKKNPHNPPNFDLDLKELENKSLVLIDDVLQSGTTLMYGVRYFLQIALSQFKTAVLVDRNHKKFPVKADFKGISLSTSTSAMVEVKFNDHSSAEAFLIN